MKDKTTQNTSTQQHGYWFTTSKGQHIYVNEDETPKEACERVYKDKAEERESKAILSSDVSKLYGEEFKGYKGQAAIDKLLKEQRGHVKGAFHRDDIGDIDLVWGSDYLGLQHIIKHREEQGINVQQFLSNIAEVVEKGAFLQKGNNGTFEFWHNGKSVIISPEYHGNKVTYLLTAYKKTLKKNRVPKQ